MARGVTRKTLRESIARKLFGMIEGTADSGGTTTIVDADLSRYANDYFNGAQAYIVTDAGGASAAPEGETSWVSDFVSSTGTLTIAPALTAAVGAGDTYQVFMQVSKADIDRALAYAAAGTMIATSLTPKTDSVDYYLCDIIGLTRGSQIARVGYRPHGDVKIQPGYIRDWLWEDAEAMITLRLSRTLNSDDHLWIEYPIDHTYFVDDTRILIMTPRLVEARACIELCEQVMHQQDANGAALWGTRLRYWQDVEKLERQRNPPHSGRVKLTNWFNVHGDEEAGAARGWDVETV